MTTRTNAGNAIRAIEALHLAEHRKLDPAQWTAFASLMFDVRHDFLRGIAEAAEARFRAFHPKTIHGFSARCDAIFNRGCGGYSHEMMNTWLYANDLKHLLHAEAGGVIRW